MGVGLKHHLSAIDIGAKVGAKIYGAKLGARIYGAKLSAKSPPRLRRAQDLGARIYSAKTWHRAKGPDFKIIPSGAYL